MFCELEAAGDSKLAIHISRALHHWSQNSRHIEREYFELPFGSRIVFENISHDVRQINIQFAPVYDIEAVVIHQGASEHVEVT